MKNKVFFSILAFVFSLIIFSSFEDQEDSTSPAFITKKYASEELIKTNELISDLFEAARAKDSAAVVKYFKETRIQYKKVEFYLESFESDFVKFINGPPIPWVEFVGGGIDAQDPHGLQVMEELVFDENGPDFKELMEECFFINKELIRFINIIDVNPTSDASVFLGLKYGLIRIEALSLPGFDCPITLQVGEEINSSLESIYKVMGFYAEAYKNKPIHSTIISTQKKIKEAQKYLQPKLGHFLDFETIDKLYFTRKHVQPIHANIVDIFESIKQETPVLVRIFRYVTHINGAAKNLYDPEFLDNIATSEKSYYGINNNERLSPDIVALGKKLFNDKRLSHNNVMSCKSCHDPKLAFADGLATSITNIDGTFQKRNSPTIVYAAFQGRLFTDVRSRTLEEQVIHVFDNPQEFNTNIDEVVLKLMKDSSLVQEFIKAFPADRKKPIKEFTVRKALGAYVRSLGKFNSEFDAYMRGEIKEIPAEVKRGFNLFMGKANCGTCHFTPTFAGTVPPIYRESETEVLGVLEKWDTLNPILSTDSGRYHTQQNEIYITSHKTPTVRNIELTGPYMHNGSLKDLETVMDFYNRGGGVGMGLKLAHQTLDPKPLNLNQEEIQDIIAFMKSLTDRQFLEKNVDE
ncbi:MAG TPA: cytochrome c peroxidase [Chitinophagales bacterium]|nr:cytochrome c peroxidase [Chitinophagales bacterium]